MEVHKGIRCLKTPPLLNALEGTSMGAIILACSKTMYTDYFMARDYFKSKKRKYEIIAINMAISLFSLENNTTHAVGMHSKGLQHFLALRRLFEPGCHCSTHSVNPKPGVDYVWRFEDEGGTSAHYALQIAILIGYAEIIICGNSLDNSGHFYDPPEAINVARPEDNHAGITSHWERLAEQSKEARERVRSTTGPLTKIFTPIRGGQDGYTG